MLQCHFAPEEYIIRENAYGETFYIIRQGKVKVMQTHPQTGLPVLIRHLQKGDYFGEKALVWSVNWFKKLLLIGSNPVGVKEIQHFYIKVNCNEILIWMCSLEFVSISLFRPRIEYC